MGLRAHKPPNPTSISGPLLELEGFVQQKDGTKRFSVPPRTPHIKRQGHDQEKGHGKRERLSPDRKEISDGEGDKGDKNGIKQCRNQDPLPPLDPLPTKELPKFLLEQ